MTTTETKQEAVYRKVRALLHKAESTQYEAEAEVFYEKAQELIMRYAIDEEKMWENDPKKRERIITHDVTIADRVSGAQERRMILHACARANRCRMWYTPRMNQSTIAGFDTDVMFVEMLYSAICTQMNFKMAIGVATNPQIHHKTYKNSFYVGYANRIWDRFNEMTKKNTETIKSESESQALVLLDRKAQVDKWVDENMRLNKGQRRTHSNINSTAADHGIKAANEADLSGGRGHLRSQKELK